MKKNGLFTMVAILMAAMLATGCSKSENENMGGNGSSQKYLTEQEIQDLILPLLVGSWVHDGDCVSEVKSIGTDGITAIDSEYSFSESEKDTLKFTADGKVCLSWPDDGTLPWTVSERFGFDYNGRIYHFYGGLVAGNGGYEPPYGIDIHYEVTPYERDNKYQAVLFDGSRRYLYLKPSYERWGDKIIRYRKL